MWPYHADLLAVPVPRYTSFPTAAEFGPLKSDPYREALACSTGDVSLYLHIPFCEQICFYCGCTTGKANRKERLQSYLAALTAEMTTVAQSLPQGARVRRIAFGGGSPNAIAADAFLALMDALNRCFTLFDPIISVELDPRSMTPDWAKAMGQVGVQRASLGVQTFADHCQRAIGRIQPQELVARSVDQLRSAGVTSLNFDLMYGLPGQSQSDLEDSLVRATALGADRVALFGYAHVPQLIARQRMIDEAALPDQRERFAMAAIGHRTLVSHGYTAVGFDHFAKASDPLAQAASQGRLHRNFQGFTDDCSNTLIGLGASAVSSFPELLAQNEKNTGRYRMKCSDNQFATSRGVLRSADDRYRGAVIEQLLCHGRARLGAGLAHSVRARLEPFIDRGCADLAGEWLTIRPDGLPYARSIAAVFDPYRSHCARRFSSAV